LSDPVLREQKKHQFALLVDNSQQDVGVGAIFVSRNNEEWNEKLNNRVHLEQEKHLPVVAVVQSLTQHAHLVLRVADKKKQSNQRQNQE
jgi:hypothetical protein